MRFRDLPSGAVRLRPHRSLLWQALFGAAAFVIPLSAVLYFLTIGDGYWPWVLGLQVAILLVFLASWLSYRFTGFWVTAEGIAERGFFGMKTYIPKTAIDSIVFANTYRGSADETSPQLFICDEKGRQLMRMRGQFWSAENMRLVSETLEIPLSELGESVSTGELLDLHPGLLYWFERHPYLFAAAIGALLVLVGSGLHYLITTVKPAV